MSFFSHPPVSPNVNVHKYVQCSVQAACERNTRFHNRACCKPSSALKSCGGAKARKQGAQSGRAFTSQTPGSSPALSRRLVLGAQYNTYIYIYIYIYVHIYIEQYVYIYIHTYTHILFYVLGAALLDLDEVAPADGRQLRDGLGSPKIGSEDGPIKLIKMSYFGGNLLFQKIGHFILYRLLILWETCFSQK